MLAHVTRGTQLNSVPEIYPVAVYLGPSPTMNIDEGVEKQG